MPWERLVRVRSDEVLDVFRVRLEFTDDTRRDIDLEPYLSGPIFEPIRHNPAMFRAVKVDKRMGTIVWENGADIDPDVLYHGLKPAWMEMEEASESDAHCGALSGAASAAAAGAAGPATQARPVAGGDSPAAGVVGGAGVGSHDHRGRELHAD